MASYKRAWERDKARVDGFAPLIKRDLGEAFVVDATLIEDQKANTDYRFLIEGKGTVAARIRTVTEYRNKSGGHYWGDEITIRASRPSGVKTELHKMLGGEADIFYYGWGDSRAPRSIPAHIILRLEHIRNWINALMVPSIAHPWFQANPPWEIRENQDGTKFWAVPIAALPAKAIVRRVCLPPDYVLFEERVTP